MVHGSRFSVVYFRSAFVWLLMHRTCWANYILCYLYGVYGGAYLEAIVDYCAMFDSQHHCYCVSPG
jgi:hypothetical protein